MAVTAKEKVNPEIMLEDPKETQEKPSPRPEAPRDGEYTLTRAVRDLRDKLARDRVTLENGERRERGPRVGQNIYYKKAQKKLVSRLFLTLGTDKKKIILQKNTGGTT